MTASQNKNCVSAETFHYAWTLLIKFARLSWLRICLESIPYVVCKPFFDTDLNKLMTSAMVALFF